MSIFEQEFNIEHFVKENIIIDAKWHRICFCFSLRISYKEINQNLEILFDKFNLIQRSWNKYKKKTIDQKSF